MAAVQVCESPAQAGDALSQYHLGMIFRALKSYSKALFWLKKSAEERFVEADFELGQLYRLGLGVTSDMTSARMWYQRAASRHKHQALYYLGLIAGNVLEAYAWFNLAAQAGIAKAADKRDELHQGFNENQRQAAQKLSLALYRELK